MKRAVVAVVIVTGYSWVVSGSTPFSTTTYLVTAAPCVAFVAIYARLGGLSAKHVDVNEYFHRKARGVTTSSVAPWIALLSAAVALEVIGLLLGGRSTDVPTLSTTVDHVLAVRWGRFLLCLAWLSTGGFALFRQWRLIQVGRS